MTEPYYQDDAVTLYCGDWRELIDPSFTADLIVTDPPYGETSLEWDRWPLGWPALASKHARSMWCFGSMRMFLDRRDDFDAWKLSQDVVWEKHNGSVFHADRFRRVHEHATHWYWGAWSEVHHDAPQTRGTPKTYGRKTLPSHTGKIRGERYENDGRRVMRSVIFARSMNGHAINETEKPVPLIEPLILYGCPTGGTVLDLFAGSASTLIAARNLGRKAIGYEKREQQCEAAAKRLAQGVLDFGEVS